MESVVLTQLSIPEIRQLFRQELENFYSTLSPQQTTSPPVKPLTVTGAAEFLNLEPATIYSLVAKKAIPHSKKGKRLYFLESELSEWLAVGRKKTNAELATDAGNYLRKGPKRKGAR